MRSSLNPDSLGIVYILGLLERFLTIAALFFLLRWMVSSRALRVASYKLTSIRHLLRELVEK